MPTQTVTVSLVANDESLEKIEGKNLTDVDGDPIVENDTQIVTILDGGDLRDDGDIVTYEFAFFGTSSTDNDQFQLDLSGFNDDFKIAVKSQDPGDEWHISGFDSYTVNGNVWTFSYTGTDGSSHTFEIDAESTNGYGVATVVVCFVRGTRILTPEGERPIETLRQGDKVCCGDGEVRPVCWIGHRFVESEILSSTPRLRPVVFAPGSLAEGVPSRALRLSPQHRLLLSDWRAELLFGESQVLVPAKSLINDTCITRDHACEDVEYFHILLDGHHTVIADGVECESLMPAELALTALDGGAREELLILFPELAADIDHFGPIYRQVLKNFETAVLMSAGNRAKDRAANQGH